MKRTLLNCPRVVLFPLHNRLEILQVVGKLLDLAGVELLGRLEFLYTNISMRACASRRARRN